MKKLIAWLSRLPIKWKLAIWSSLLLFCSFAAYNGIQYLVIHNWFYQQEELRIQKVMSQVQGFYAEKGPSLTADEIVRNQAFLDRLNEKNQMIRIVTSTSQPVLAVTNGIPTDWVFPGTPQPQNIVYTKHGDDHLLVMQSPLVTQKFVGTIEIVRVLENFDQLMNLVSFVMLLGGLVGVGISLLAGFFLARKLIAPVQAITGTMRTIRDKGLGERVQFENNGDELSELAVIFNDMMDRLEWSFQQQKQFVEDASHELRTPLSIMEGHLGLLNRWGKHDPAVLDESLAAVAQEVQRLKTLVMELLELSRAERTRSISNAHAIDLAPVVEQVIRNLKVLHPDFSFDLDLAPIERVSVLIAPNHFEQILLILLDNAIKYSAEDKRITISGSRENHHLFLAIEDTGEGISEEDLPYVLRRFYRADKARSRENGGSGLGLSIASRLLEAAHGQIQIESQLGVGTKVILKLPVV